MANFKYFTLFIFTYTIPQYNNTIYFYNSQLFSARTAQVFMNYKEKRTDTEKSFPFYRQTAEAVKKIKLEQAQNTAKTQQPQKFYDFFQPRKSSKINAFRKKSAQI